ncbi:MAG: MBL fold metallo-hydrolase [Planctomycetes bacterium]|nr:MBL fold metallo-hydrolase [Planctomycetota bacterium]
MTTVGPQLQRLLAASAIVLLAALTTQVAGLSPNQEEERGRQKPLANHSAPRERNRAATSRPASTAALPDVIFTIVYDNNDGPEGLTSDWGFACLVKGLEKTILFDTGANGEILLHNMRRLGLDPATVDVVVLSHSHDDHTRGLAALLEGRSDVPVYAPSGFPASLNAYIRRTRATLTVAEEPVLICRGARTTGTLGKDAIPEHGLCVDTRSGWVLITGCAHPGVENLAARATELVGCPLHLVMGGFHLPRAGESSWSTAAARLRIDATLKRMVELNVQHVAPLHCSGDLARGLFQQSFGARCELAGVGAVFAPCELNDRQDE